MPTLPPSASLLVDGRPVQGRVTLEQEWIDVTPREEPDPFWRYVDSHGHEHRWMAKPEDGGPPVPLRDPSHQSEVLPTLAFVLDEPYWCEDCHETHQFGHYECALCGGEVEPGMRPANPGSYQMPGLLHASFDVDEALALGPVTVTVLYDPPQTFPGQVVDVEWNSDGSGSSRIIGTGAPVTEAPSANTG